MKIRAKRIKQAIEALKIFRAAMAVDNGIHGIRILGSEAGHELIQVSKQEEVRLSRENFPNRLLND